MLEGEERGSAQHDSEGRGLVDVYVHGPKISKHYFISFGWISPSMLN